LNSGPDIINISGAAQNKGTYSPPVIAQKSDQTIQEPVIKPPEKVLGKQQEAFQKPVSKRQIRTYIDMLANEGLPPEEIASRLEISIAEVDLAMNLRRK